MEKKYSWRNYWRPREATTSAAARDAGTRRDGRKLPRWTGQYPSEYRERLARAGADPSTSPRAHEGNLRVIEICKVFEIAGIDLHSNHAGRKIDEETLCCAVGEVWDRLQEFENCVPLPARPADEVEVQLDWKSMYPAEFGRLLESHGVPTVAGSLTDEYNKRLIETVPPGCSDDAQLRVAAGLAARYVFGPLWWRAVIREQEPDTEDLTWHLDEDDPVDLYWGLYPEEHRELLARYGRLDYEHPNAESYNRALIAGSNFIKEHAHLDDAAVGLLREHLWRAFFGDERRP